MASSMSPLSQQPPTYRTSYQYRCILQHSSNRRVDSQRAVHDTQQEPSSTALSPLRSLSHLGVRDLVPRPRVQVVIGALRVLVQVVDEPRGVGDDSLCRMATRIAGGRCCSRLEFQQRCHCVPLSSLTLHSLRRCRRRDDTTRACQSAQAPTPTGGRVLRPLTSNLASRT